mgnify:CR=1 FL=1
MAVGCLQRPKSNQQQQRETLSKRASNSLPQCNTKRVVFTCRYHLLLGGLSHQQNKALEVLTIAIKRTRYLSLTINQPSCLFESNHPPSFVFWGALACFFCHINPGDVTGRSVKRGWFTAAGRLCALRLCFMHCRRARVDLDAC